MRKLLKIATIFYLLGFNTTLLEAQQQIFGDNLLITDGRVWDIAFEDLNKDGNLSSYEKKRGKAIETAMGKAYGGTVKKYAMGGGVRKVRKDNY